MNYFNKFFHRDCIHSFNRKKSFKRQFLYIYDPYLGKCMAAYNNMVFKKNQILEPIFFKKGHETQDRRINCKVTSTFS